MPGTHRIGISSRINAGHAGPIAIGVALAQIVVGLLVVGAAASRHPKRSLRIPAFAFVLLGSLALFGCGANEKPGTPAGTCELTIKGTANGRTHTLSLPVTVR